jgi:hypothetical protein
VKALQIEVKSAATTDRGGVSQRTGKPWHATEQEAYAHVGEVYPVKIRFRLEDGQRAYQPGLYFLSPESFFAGQYGDLTVGRLKLVAVTAAPAAVEGRQQGRLAS